nr:hypothetical protein [Myxococcota bacterium]
GPTASAGTRVTAADFPPAAGLPPACEDFRKAMVRLAVCPAYPAEAGAAFKDSWATMRSAWTDVSTMPASAQQAIGETCQQGTESLAGAISAMQC